MEVNFTKSLKEKVAKLLEEYPRLRDSDHKLMATIWKQEAKEMNCKVQNQTGYEFLKMFAEGKFTPSESIMRVRRKLQELNPNLRGDTYTERHAKEEVIIEQVRNF